MTRIITFQIEATVEQKWVLCYYVVGSSKMISKNHDQIQVTVEQTAYIGMQILPLKNCLIKYWQEGINRS